MAEPCGVVAAEYTDEHAGLAAVEGGGVDAGALERFPGSLEQHALLGIEGEGLARADAEERRVEASGVVDEPALADRAVVAIAGRDLPAAVVGETGDGVATGGEQLPQVVRGADVAGEPAAHGDDRDRIVVGGERHDRRDSRGGGLGGVLAEQLGGQQMGEGAGGRVVEQQRGFETQSRCSGKPIAQLDGHQRVEAELLERALGVERRSRREAQDGGDLGADQLEQDAVALGRGQPAQAVLQGGGAGGVGGEPAGGARADEAAKHRRQRGLIGERGGVEPRGDEGGVGAAERGVERGEALVRRQREHAAARHAAEVGGGQVSGDAGALGPVAPGERGRGEAVGAPVVCERVEEDVGGGVVRLARAAEHARQRRK